MAGTISGSLGASSARGWVVGRYGEPEVVVVSWVPPLAKEVLGHGMAFVKMAFLCRKR